MARAATVRTRREPPDDDLTVTFDPADVELHPGVHRFHHDPLDGPARALLDAFDGINGNPLDWARATDPGLTDTLVAVRTNPEGEGPAAWFDSERRLREETFHSPLSGRFWVPDTQLVRRLLRLTPYVLARRDEDRVQYAFDVRTLDDVAEAAKALRSYDREVLLPASGAFSTREHELEAMCVRVPFAGDRYARSTRKRFRLAVPGSHGDATVEGVAARILTHRGYLVETPRLLIACYRLLVGEPVSAWWRHPDAIERSGDLHHHPPGANPLEATQRALAAVAEIEGGAAPAQLRLLGHTLVAAGKRPATYTRYTERLARFAEAFGGPALASCLEGQVVGHRSMHADLVVAHSGTGQSMLVEVKSRGDRIRATQVESALWHARSGRADFRIMKVDHPLAQ